MGVRRQSTRGQDEVDLTVADLSHPLTLGAGAQAGTQGREVCDLFLKVGAGLRGMNCAGSGTLVIP